jgi:hypothetical protein
MMKLSCHVSLKDGDLALAQGRWSREMYESVVLEGTLEVSCKHEGSMNACTAARQSLTVSLPCKFKCICQVGLCVCVVCSV